MKKVMGMVILLLSINAHASLVTTGTLVDNGLGAPIDYWIFSTAGGEVTIDLLSWETSPFGTDLEYQFANYREVNGDGEASFFDTFISLSTVGGSLVAENDDDLTFSDGFTDGSIFHYDSYLKIILDPGAYILSVSSFNDMLYTCQGPVNTQCGPDGPIQSSTGDYQITWGGDLDILSSPIGVGSPANISLLIFGLLTIFLARFKLQ